MKFNRVLIGSALVAATIGGQAFAADAPAAAPAGPTLSDILKNSGITANGWISGGYTYGFNGVDLAGREFDGKTDSFLLNQAVLNVAFLPTDGFGGAVTLLGGEDAQAINTSYGDFGGTNSKVALNQAYLQYASGALTVIGGRYNTLAGAEVIADPLNTNVSRSFLFTLAEPFVHTGVRATYKFSDLVTAYLGVANSAEGGAAEDPDKRKTLEGGVSLTPSTAVSLNLYDYYGVESASGAGDKRNYLDFVGSFQATDALTFVINADYTTMDEEKTPGSPKAKTYGVAGYVNAKISDMLKLSVRAETLTFDDTGSPKEHLSEGTITLDYAPASNFDLLLEARSDFDKDKVFPEESGDFKKSQPDVAIKGIYKFGSFGS